MIENLGEKTASGRFWLVSNSSRPRSSRSFWTPWRTQHSASMILFELAAFDFSSRFPPCPGANGRYPSYCSPLYCVSLANLPPLLNAYRLLTGYHLFLYCISNHLTSFDSPVMNDRLLTRCNRLPALSQRIWSPPAVSVRFLYFFSLVNRG